MSDGADDACGVAAPKCRRQRAHEFFVTPARRRNAMIDAIAAATGAVGLVTPALIEIGKGAAAKVGETAAGKVLAWLRAKATGSAHAALNDLERDPASADNQAGLRKQLSKLLEQEPSLLDELRTLLPARPAGDAFAQRLEAGAKGAQVKGDGNTITIT
jgi:hypothetical protein